MDVAEVGTVVKKGQTLSFDFLKKGARAYIAVSGGIDVPVVLGSRSTYTLGALGGCASIDRLHEQIASANANAKRMRAGTAVSPKPGSSMIMRTTAAITSQRIIRLLSFLKREEQGGTP